MEAAASGHLNKHLLGTILLFWKFISGAGVRQLKCVDHDENCKPKPNIIILG